jgi:hypothetical protein
MKRNWIVRATKIALLGTVALALFGFVVMSLWNWLMPALFGWHTIGYWQALGILVLSKILFGGLRGGRPGRHWYWRRRMMERWEKMTPEEREKFRAGFRGRCGPYRGPDTGQKETIG